MNTTEESNAGNAARIEQLLKESKARYACDCNRFFQIRNLRAHNSRFHPERVGTEKQRLSKLLGIRMVAA